jgi:hypothetical protein
VEMWLALTGSTVMHAGIQVAHELWRLWGALAVKRFAFRRCRRRSKAAAIGENLMEMIGTMIKIRSMCGA